MIYVSTDLMLYSFAKLVAKILSVRWDLDTATEEDHANPIVWKFHCSVKLYSVSRLKQPKCPWNDEFIFKPGQKKLQVVYRSSVECGILSGTRQTVCNTFLPRGLSLYYSQFTLLTLYAKTPPNHLLCWTVVLLRRFSLPFWKWRETEKY